MKQNSHRNPYITENHVRIIIYYVAETNDEVFIGNDLPLEYTGSVYSKRLKGANAKAKANVIQGLPELIEIAKNREFEENHKEKHRKDAKYGWYRYDTRFALPVFGKVGEIERYNVFNARILVRHAGNGKKYLRTSPVFLCVIAAVSLNFC